MVRTVMQMTISADHRVTDGAECALFLQGVKNCWRRRSAIRDLTVSSRASPAPSQGLTQHSSRSRKSSPLNSKRKSVKQSGYELLFGSSAGDCDLPRWQTKLTRQNRAL